MGNVHKSFEPTAQRGKLRREEWRKRMVLSRSFKRCSHAAWTQGQSQCEYWDRHITTASDPELNRWRKNNRSNYLAWAKAFSRSLETNEEAALTALSKVGVCVPCLGRSLFEVLESELVAPHLKLDDFTHALESANFTAELQVVTKRADIERRDSVRSGMTAELVSFVRNACGRPHLNQLATLLNHGRKMDICFKRGTLGCLDFKLITTNFTASMLRQRANAGSYSRMFVAMTKDLPMDRWGDMDFPL